MASRLSNDLLKKWSDSQAGGRKQAAIKIMDALQCSTSMGEKIAAGRYASLPSPLAREALVELTKLPAAKLFPSVSAEKKSQK